ncbi:MAG: glycerol kinase GlpK [Alicyclobacillaceae bacterium]|nr:glycerol kinase GlpK [Alicyclobacillaceae bacterium]
MSGPWVIAIDQGTTSTRAVLFDARGQVAGLAFRPVQQHYPEPGWVEHDVEEIWLGVIDVVTQVLRDAGVTPGEVAAIGITNQRETTVLWERATGRPVHRALVWQSRQSAAICDQWRQQGLEVAVKAKTGLVLDPYFSASKIRWLLDCVPGVRDRAERGELLFGTIDTWLIWKLTGGRVHVTDCSNAARTMLYNIHEQRWDEQLLQAFGIPAGILPEVRSSSEVYGYTSAAWFGRPLPIAGAAGDQQAALFGQACFQPGMAKNTYGTGCFLLMNTGERPVASEHGLVTTIAWKLGQRVCYALEGSVFVAGAVLQWLRDELGLLATAAESEALALSVPSTGGVYMVPAFTGLGAPFWDMQARGAILGITRGTTRAHVVRAALESVAYQSRDVLDAMEADAGVRLERLRVDGGASINRFLMQFQADILGVPVERPEVHETTALGAAFLAGLAVGVWDNEDAISANWRRTARFDPAMDGTARERLYAGWRDAVSRILTRPMR